MLFIRWANCFSLCLYYTECDVNPLHKQFYSETQTPQILEPKCVRASPKPEDMIGDRRSLKEYMELHSPPPRPALECRVRNSLSHHYMLYFRVSCMCNKK